MMDYRLTGITRAALAGKYKLPEKADIERERDGNDFDGIETFTKGKVSSVDEADVYYILSPRNTRNSAMLNTKTCPMCVSRRVKVVTRDVRRVWLGKHGFVTPAVTFHDRPSCGEKLYGPEALRKMELFRPKSIPRMMRRRAS